jgi:tetratricopeptide (TPR) repeat protein
VEVAERQENPLNLPDSFPHSLLSAPREAYEEPSHDVAVCREWGALAPEGPFPHAFELKEDLRRLFSRAREFAVVIYPAKAPIGLATLARTLQSGFTLEGFVPHRYPATPHDREETSGGDLYFFSLNGRALPAPFGITGGPSAGSPIAAADAPTRREETEELLLKLKSHTAAGLFQESLPLLYRLLSANPSDVKLRLNLAVILHILGETPEAIRLFLGILAEDPLNGQARVALAKIHLANQSYGDLRAFLPETLLLRATDPFIQKSWPEIRASLLELDQKSHA